VTGDFSAGVDGDFLASVWVDADLAREEEKVLIPKKKIEDVGILEEKAALFGDFNGERSEIELLLIDIGVGEVGVDGCERDEISCEAVLDVDTTGVKRTPWLARNALRAKKAVRFDDEKAAAFDAVETSQFASL